tara:strand:+ start:150 stop:755 length:606 start_codon:yes stop_codon:yes gene_type:complete
MIERKKKLRIIQLSLLTFGILIIFFTYLGKNETPKKKIITGQTEKKIKKQLENLDSKSDVFYNIEYSGLDLNGNRYVLKSDEASNNKASQEIINMKTVTAIFYFKDDTVLKVISDRGVYNTKTLDMTFDGSVKANYEGSELSAGKASYENSKGLLTISEKVKINDFRGSIIADKFLFDIKNQTLNIDSFNNNKINANVRIK